MSPPPAATPPVAGRALSLDEVVAIALERQPQILARIGQVEAAKAGVLGALSPLLPQMTLQYTQFRQQGFLASLGSPFTITNYLAQQTASLTVFDFGKTFAAVDAAKANTQATQEALEQTRDQIVFNAKQAYFTLLLSQRLVRVNQQALERAELNLRSARGFFEVGTRPKSDVTRAEVDVANAQVNLIRANNAVQLGRVSLNASMGLSPEQPIAIQDILTYEPMPVTATELAGEALRNRHEVRQAGAQVKNAEANARAAFRQFFPNVTANGSYGYTVNNEFPPNNEIWQIGFTFAWTWFPGLTNVAGLRQAKANLDSAKATAASVELSVRQDVEQTYLSLVEAEERIRAAGKAVESAQENFRLAQGRFDAGIGTIIELTDAQLALTQAQSTELQALSDFRVARASLERALGRR